MHEVVERIEEATLPPIGRAYGRAEHLPQPKPSGMLTVERLTEVEWALGKIRDAERAVDKLLESEPTVQPPGERRVVMAKVRTDLSHLHERLEGLFS